MIQAVCWVLIHSLWQGLLLAVAAGSVILFTKRSAVAVRYRLLCGLFFLFLAMAGLTFFYELYAAGAGGVVDGGGAVSSAAGVFLTQVDRVSRYCSEHALPIVLLWILFFSVKLVRMAFGWGYIRRVRRENVVVAPAVWVERVRLLSGQLGIRQGVQLLESGLVRVPIVIGQLRPVIFIPLGLINHLPAGEMEAVLLHELAHIRRCDYVVNFVQQLAECLFFFNPGLLWISALLREEREHCCDDMAIARTRDRVAFVRALVRFKEHSLKEAALAFPAGKRQLLYRVLRISQQQNKTLNGRERFFLLGSCLVLALLLFSAGRSGAGKGFEKKGDTAARAAAVSPVSPVLVSVLQKQEQVAKNMEWVEEQLKQLRRKAVAAKAGHRRVQPDKGQPDMVQAERNQQQEEQNQQQTLKNETPDVLNRQEAERSREQAVRDQVQARLDQEQAQRDRVQGDKDREQAQRDRMQADRDRQQAELERQKAESDRQRAEKERKKA